MILYISQEIVFNGIMHCIKLPYFWTRRLTFLHRKIDLKWECILGPEGKIKNMNRYTVPKVSEKFNYRITYYFKALFGSTYLYESTFSSMNVIKNKNTAQLSDLHLES